MWRVICRRRRGLVCRVLLRRAVLLLSLLLLSLLRLLLVVVVVVIVRIRGHRDGVRASILLRQRAPGKVPGRESN